MKREPINKLAALGMNRKEFEHDSGYIDIEVNQLKRKAKLIKKLAKATHAECLNLVAQKHGYKNFNHYQEIKKSRGEYLTSVENSIRKKAKATAKYEANRHCGLIS